MDQSLLNVLDGHWITQVDTTTIRSIYPRQVGRNSFRGAHGSGGTHQVVVLTSSRGHVGWSPALGPIDDIAGFVGRSLGELIDPESGTFADAIAIDYALHDLAGNILDMPVYAMLGNAGSKQLRVYSGGIYFDDLDPTDAPSGIEAIKRNLAQDFSLGFRDFKLKLGRGYRWMQDREGLQRDIEVTRLTRELYPDARILVDPNDGYSYNAIAEYLEAVADVSLYWVEEVFAERLEDMVGLRTLVDELTPGTLIADGEYRPDLQNVTKLASEGLVDVVLMDVLGFGLTAWRHSMPAIIDAGARISPHAWGWPLKTFYAAQIAAGLGYADIIEGVPGKTEGVDASAYRFEEGVLSIPERPGFGLPLGGHTVE